MHPAAIAVLASCASGASRGTCPQEPAPTAGERASIEAGAWLALGPFDLPAGVLLERETPLDKHRKRAKPGAPWNALEDSFAGREHAKLRWTPVEAGVYRAPDAAPLDSGVIDLEAALGLTGAESENAAAFLYREIRCAAAARVPIACGSDDGLRLWLNGELVLERGEPRMLHAYDERAELALEPGANHLLVEVTNQSGGWYFEMVEPRPAQPEEIDRAIEGGVAYLLARQVIDGSWAEHQDGFPSGTTALCVYTLAQCGVARHPAFAQALASLDAFPPERTYSLACRILAFSALSDAERRARIADDVDQLLAWQEDSGGWSYPEKAADLSNTQLAALALRAAAAAGVEIPPSVWSRMLDFTLRMQEGKKREPAAGFRYIVADRPTGSMTAAGVGILAIIERALGERLTPRQREDLAGAEERGLAWLDANWSVARNPQHKIFHVYYLYALERIGALLERDRIGAHDWYAEGAEWLVRSQERDGGWNGSAVDTCFALLFLERATRPRTGAPRARDLPSDPVSPEVLAGYARDALANRLPERLASTASSSAARGAEAAHATDNRSWTRWLCAANDADPWIEVELERALTVERLVLTHARTERAERERNPRPARVELTFDRDKDARTVDLELDPRTKTIVEFSPPRTLSRFRLRVREVADGRLGAAEVGFTEIELFEAKAAGEGRAGGDR